MRAETDFAKAYAHEALQPHGGQKSPPVLAVSVYLLRQWARYLGAEGLMAVIAARQMAFEQQPRAEGRFRRRQVEGQALIRATQETISHRAAIAESTLRRALGEPGMALFLHVCSGGVSGADAPTANAFSFHRYAVRMGDPLAPHHARGLAEYLRQAMAAAPLAGEEDVEARARRRWAAYDALLRLLEGSPTQARRRLEALTPTLSPGGEGEAIPWGEGVLGVVESLELLPALAAERRGWEELCARAQALIIEPERVLIVSHYFWKEWLPRLRARRAELLMNLRSRCYYNAARGERRDTLYLHYPELAQELGVSPRQVRRLLMTRVDDARDDGLGEFVRVIEYAQKAHPPFVQILMLDPAADKSLADCGQIECAEGPNAGQIERDTNKHLFLEHPGAQGMASRFETASRSETAQNAPETDPSKPPENAAPLPEALWKAVTAQLACQLTDGVYRQYIAPLLPLALDAPPGAEKALVWLAHPNVYGAEWVEKRLAHLLVEALAAEIKTPVEIRVVCRVRKR
jgi:hypothetical protein